jgi:hypothetical protein
MALSAYEAAAVRTIVDYLSGAVGVSRVNCAGLNQRMPSQVDASNALAALAAAANKVLFDCPGAQDARELLPRVAAALQKGMT